MNTGGSSKRITRLPDHEQKADLNNLTMEEREDMESNRSRKKMGTGKFEEEKHWIPFNCTYDLINLIQL